MGNRRVPIDEELNAIVPYDPAFRFLLSRDDLSEYHKGFVNWHKQPTIEISVVYEGAVNVNVLEREQTVIAGDGFFVMPGYLHSIRPAPGFENARYFTLIFHPQILYGFSGSYYDLAYYQPLADSNTPFFVFSGKKAWTKEIFSQLKRIADQCPDDSPAFRLKTQQILQNIWAVFAAHLSDQARPASASRDTRVILQLVGYLHEYYQEKFSLDALAEHVSMSRNECCRYFKRMMHMTITEYLLEYRLSKAAALLEASDLRITEIAETTGFCDVSYFIKMFKRKTGVTPKAYAKLYAE